MKSDHLPDTTVTGRHFGLKLLDVSTSRWCRRAVFVSVELFNLVWEIRQVACYFSLFHFCHRKDTQVCKYSIKTGNSEGYTSISRVWHRYLKDK